MTKNTIKVATLSAAIVTALAGCNSSSSDEKTQPSRPSIAECKTYEPTQPVIVKGDNENLNFQTITIGATGDMHGRIFAYDYALDDVDVNAGFTKIATLLHEERAQNENFLMIDLGDTVQGNSAELFNELPIHPVVETMNHMEYDVWVPGNHEFDFSRDFLFRNLEGFNGAVISSNIIWHENAVDCKNTGQETPFLRGYQLFDYNGAKVAVIGLTPSHVSSWNASNPENFRNLDFKDEFEALENTVDQVINQYQPDIVIGALHHGRSETHDVVGVNEIASKMADKFDVIFMGHEHARFIEQIDLGAPFENGMDDISVSGDKANQVEDKAKSGAYNWRNRDSKVKVIEPGNWGWALAKAEIDLIKDQDGNWKIYDTTLSNRTVADVEEDAALQNEMQHVHYESVENANEVIGTIHGNFTNTPNGGADEAVLEEQVLNSEGQRLYTTIHSAKLSDMPLTDLINQIQIMNVEKEAEVKVDVSAAALFSDASNLFDGETYRRKDSANLYMYDNQLVAVNITGDNLRKYMEWSYSYFNQYQDGDLTVSFDETVASFNYDIFDGDIEYVVDLSQEVGERVIFSQLAGAPFDADRTYVLAINDYRFGSTMLVEGWVTEEDKIWDSSDLDTYAIRDMLTNYVEENGLDRTKFENVNWFIKQYGESDERGVVAPHLKGEILQLREDDTAGKELWERLQNKEICVMRSGPTARDAINVSVNVKDEDTWYENPNYSESASIEALYQGCTYANQPKS
ncbi:bifunctional metallophosphatase/5'-nucleotidase [Photobacterium sp. ZSDE20]|uniref:Bifunctional metallophosphatase/5'-nucleotidase n=1 Tax=Photobacterium pectinilyticum TaxID=2906793 RepID=A0ABT1N3G3_9GAMM|nr:bifunctional metallophosphatase/5'-nucleotidase [Photobacterium sp. ZSDE20]MCQ1058647.1 bifunctional metallophosphatase/5'-nucleotidase [Photobacterium sp. ZSDE20]MDD1823361.1 bifunctional metallophosphatase/5'-nucleotidase [Photobacterium sp. ZSDE20]